MSNTNDEDNKIRTHEEEIIDSSELESYLIYEDIIDNDSSTKEKADRKAAKKLKKQLRRAKREGRADPSVGQKECDICTKKVDLLIRCTHDESLQWKLICGKCWKGASGGVVDGDSDHPYYKYGGLWKNRHAMK
eukprot:CAMPEP_0184873374 /NCGR_PEP_ID=MMETSP0580-20130426/41809_1 /TAXON_ID=1118495 /ORGANISM="Dactyliosolen fragilissimus" /LENGTH=133 /DNA_ID=CAMNT_0027376275 /DNA_START=426 /DNA_END=827 /DNA_ORIENTATION=+